MSEKLLTAHKKESGLYSGTACDVICMQQFPS